MTNSNADFQPGDRVKQANDAWGPGEDPLGVAGVIGTVVTPRFDWRITVEFDNGARYESYDYYQLVKVPDHYVVGDKVRAKFSAEEFGIKKGEVYTVTIAKPMSPDGYTLDGVFDSWSLDKESWDRVVDEPIETQLAEWGRILLTSYAEEETYTLAEIAEAQRVIEAYDDALTLEYVLGGVKWKAQQ